jgi:predicted alpha/beta-fold hydrolase
LNGCPAGYESRPVENAVSQELKNMKHLIALFLITATLFLNAAEKKKPALPAGVKAVDYPCTIDNSRQKAMYFIAKGSRPRPLLVALHTWGGSYRQSCRNYAAYCVKNNWNFIFPDFRGPNKRPDAKPLLSYVEVIQETAKKFSIPVLALYHKLGFREVGRRKGYYAKGGEDAVLMDLDLRTIEIEVSI